MIDQSPVASRFAPTAAPRVLLIGATGTIGRATVRALVARGAEVVCFVRPRSDRDGGTGGGGGAGMLAGAQVRFGNVTDPASLARDGFCGERFDAVVSCLASRSGAPKDAWAVDHRANLNALDAAREAGAGTFVLLSAICVQRPLLAFQHAKRAFEAELMASGLTYAIVRPTAFFKSLSGQIERVRQGKPFLVFGDGELTACKPISDDDLGCFIAACVFDESRHNQVLPIGGPGPAITPKQQGEALFRLLGRSPKFKHVPVALLDGIIGGLALLGRVSPTLAEKAELARIGRYYATQSMLVLDPATDTYDADATPSTGSDTLFAYYERVLNGEATVERGEHSVF
ncbi:NAD(P)H-binding protein [Stappia sp. ES.058]|uniref:NAD(P)H-binding protein n=1 Tax=Stappia sp. ES.058 TaxID=1881061 RepID=UPI00087A71D1|nr:NAD(P)H-binding protein [Stappia sp. ES.058]SDU32251.1 divinylchlorophyllide 8-vinylreductase [Stappia sp. ES.058]